MEDRSELVRSTAEETRIGNTDTAPEDWRRLNRRANCGRLPEMDLYVLGCLLLALSSAMVF